MSVIIHFRLVVGDYLFEFTNLFIFAADVGHALG